MGEWARGEEKDCSGECWRGEAEPGAAKDETAGCRELELNTPEPETTSRDSRKLDTEVLRACREAWRP